MSNPINTASLHATDVNTLSTWFRVLGILSVLLGMFAIGSPLIAGAATAMWVGAGMLVHGVFEFIGSLKANGWKTGVHGFLSGLLSFLAGGILLSRPVMGLAFFALLMAIYFILDGISRTILALKMRPYPGWGWSLFGGVITLLLGLMIWRQWPLSGVWAVGTLVGVRILLSGWAMIAMAAAVRSIAGQDAEVMDV